MGIRLKRIYKLGLFFLVVISLSYSLLWLFEKRFDEELWKSDVTARYKMVDNLIESQLLVQKSKSEVIAILGEPFSSSKIEKDIFVYKIGDPPSFFDSRKEHLLIIFVDQKVKNATMDFGD